MGQNELEKIEDAYDSVAKKLKEYVEAQPEEIKKEQENAYKVAEEKRCEFLRKFGVDELRKMSEEDILRYIFINPQAKKDRDTWDTLCHCLEYDDNLALVYGKLGGPHDKYILYHGNRGDIKNEWICDRKKIEKKDAKRIGKEIVDKIVNGADIIQKTIDEIEEGGKTEKNDNTEAFDKVFNELDEVIRKKGWVHKYYCLLFPQYLAPFHTSEVKKVCINKELEKRGIEPAKTLYGINRQISIIQQRAGLTPMQMQSFVDFLIEHTMIIKKNEKTEETVSDDIFDVTVSVDEKEYDINDSDFSIDDFGGDTEGGGYKVIEAVFINKDEHKECSHKTQQALSEVVYDKYKDKIKDLFKTKDDSKRKEFPIFRRKSSDPMIRGIFTKEEAEGEEWYPNRSKQVGDYYIRGFTVFSSFYFACKCLDLWGEKGDKIVLKYKDKMKEEEGGNSASLTPLPQIDDGSIDYNYVRNVIFYGPPGTGKTRKAREIAKRIVFGKTIKKNTNIKELNKTIEEQVKIVQFHPAYSYEDFVRGVTAETDEGEMLYKSEKKIFEEFAELANENQNKRYVIIIDEINRANVSSVFGELLYALEYRGQAIMSPYKRDDNGSYRLTIPDNLYVFGTMNTADRSLQNLDYAIRRRFSFVQVESNKPEPETYKGYTKNMAFKDTYYKLNVQDTDKEYFFNEIYVRVKEDIETSCARDISAEDIMPGISYFIVKEDGKGTDVPDKEHAKYKIQYELIPLLKEYAKDGMFTKMKNIELGEEKTTLIESLLNDTYKDCLLKMIEGI